jgi:cystathionine beta-synthase
MTETTPRSLTTHQSVLEMIGGTPMLKLHATDTGPCELFLKLESQNPGQSIKDRIALTMIEQAERDGLLQPGGRIIEATAGNTGIALALVATQKGYQTTVVVPDKMSQSKIAHLRAMGASVIMARSDVEKGHPEYYQDVAERLARENGWFYTNQFANEANVRAHRETTGPEIWQQMEGRIDAVVMGIGSGGTVTGVGGFLRSQDPDIEIILADPEGSILTPLVNDGETITPGAWLIEGIGEDFVPPISDLELVTEAMWISDAESFATARDLLHAEGILAGSSTGTLAAAAIRWCLRQAEPKRVVTFACDHGSKYLDKMFNDFWMLDQGFIDRPRHGDLRDLIARRHGAAEDHTLSPQLPILQAIKTMWLYDISQMAVLDENGQVVGILDESDILMGVHDDHGNFSQPVSQFMTRKLETLTPSDPIEALIPLFAADKVAIVVGDDGSLHGLITKIDFINHLRRQLPR